MTCAAQSQERITKNSSFEKTSGFKNKSGSIKNSDREPLRFNPSVSLCLCVSVSLCLCVSNNRSQTANSEGRTRTGDTRLMKRQGGRL
jgi:hypothetical protein